MASKNFYTAAMASMRRKHTTQNSDVLFIMASDDMEWCKAMFKYHSDVVFTSDAGASRYSDVQPTFDLAVMAQCNHSITR